MGPKITLALLLILTACATTPQPSPISDPKAVWCSANEPTRYTADERSHLTDDTKRLALEHNLKGADWCGWKP